MQRTFIIGDEWLYYKLYTGTKTADMVLTEIVGPVTEQLIQNGTIDKWFFIRYSDPKNHLRFRFHFKKTEQIATIIQTVNKFVRSFIDQNLIWKIQVDTYQREIERYGKNSIDIAENIFHYDSEMIIKMLEMIEGDEGEIIRWLFSLRAIDSLLDDFSFSIDQKKSLMDMLQLGFGKEFNKNTFLQRQLSKKFRKDRQAIDEVLNHKNDKKSEMLPLFELLKQKSLAINPYVKEILILKDSNKLQISIDDLMGSYIHMMMNRIFKSKQRLHEMVIYDFLYNFYRSEIARLECIDR